MRSRILRKRRSISCAQSNTKLHAFFQVHLESLALRVCLVIVALIKTPYVLPEFANARLAFMPKAVNAVSIVN